MRRKKEVRKGNVKESILRAIGLSGLLVTALVAPGVLKIYRQHKKREYQKQHKHYVNTVIKKMIQAGLIETVVNDKGQNCLQLTEAGERELANYEFENIEIKKPWRWDKKFRIIIFDIKEYKRKTRDELRIWLENLGFVKLQNSVWVHPYDCREVMVLLKSHFHIGKEVLYLTVDSIENDKWLREEFKLPLS